MITQQRIRRIRAVHSEIMAADAVRAAERLAFDPSPDADKERRYVMSHDRLYIQTIGTFLKVRKAGNDGTVVDADTDGVAPLDVAAISPSLARRASMRPATAEASVTDPSLALRARLGPAPAEVDPIDTSPKRQRGVGEIACENGAQKVPFLDAQTMPQALEQHITRGEEIPVRIEPGVRTGASPSEAPVGGTSWSRPTEPSTVGSRTTEPSPAQSPEAAADARITGPSAPARMQPHLDAILEPLDEEVDVELEEQARRQAAEWLKRWETLPPELSSMLDKVCRQLERHMKHGHLSAERLRQYTDFVQEHLGKPA